MFWAMTQPWVMAEDVSLEHAVFWMNLHLELLAAHQKALRHMRELGAGGGGWRWGVGRGEGGLAREARRGGMGSTDGPVTLRQALSRSRLRSVER